MSTEFVSFDGTERALGELIAPDEPRTLRAALDPSVPLIPRGAGLSYCVASAGAGVRSVSTAHLDRLLAFDGRTGRVVVEPGMTVGRLLRLAVSRGWHPPVLPGHPSISVGGCIGFNVHGKNQWRRGNFAESVRSLVLLHPDHGEIHCSRDTEPDLFALTLGGFGLTGLVSAVELQLDPLPGGSVRRRRLRAGHLAEAVDLMEAAAPAGDAVYSWHDLNRRGGAFGRGVVYVERFDPARVEARPRLRRLRPERRGRHRLRLLGGAGARVLSRSYGALERRMPGESLLDLETAAFPIQGRELYFELFGKRGFREYQMLLPRAAWGVAVKELEGVLERSGVAVALASLKLFGGRRTLLNFQGPGICLTIDVPASRRSAGLFARLDRLVGEAGGIANLSKDGRIPAERVRTLFPEFDRFAAALLAFDPRRRLDSSLRRRLKL